MKKKMRMFLLMMIISLTLVLLSIPTAIYAGVSQDTVKQVQIILNELGYDCGTPDGIAGSHTFEAIRQYQIDNNLSTTGEITDELLDSLGLSSGKDNTESFHNTNECITYDEYLKAEEDTFVTIEAYVQGKTNWNQGNPDVGTDTASLFVQDEDGGYYLWNVPVSEQVYNQLSEGVKIIVSGYKTEWAGGIEIVADENLTPIEIISGEQYIAQPVDVTSLLSKEKSLIQFANQKVRFSGVTVEPSGESGSPFLFGWDGSGQEGDDLYFNVSKDGNTYTFMVDTDLCDQGTDVYKAVKQLSVGDTVDLTGFLYWFDGPFPLITAVEVDGSGSTSEEVVVIRPEDVIEAPETPEEHFLSSIESFDEFALSNNVMFGDSVTEVTEKENKSGYTASHATDDWFAGSRQQYSHGVFDIVGYIAYSFLDEDSLYSVEYDLGDNVRVLLGQSNDFKSVETKLIEQYGLPYYSIKEESISKKPFRLTYYHSNPFVSGYGQYVWRKSGDSEEISMYDESQWLIESEGNYILIDHCLTAGYPTTGKYKNVYAYQHNLYYTCIDGDTVIHTLNKDYSSGNYPKMNSVEKESEEE